MVRAGSVGFVKGTLQRYRVMAAVVGVLLIVLVLVGLPLHYGYLLFDADFLAKAVDPNVPETGGAGWRIGTDISAYLGVAHGWLYMIFLITAFLLSRKADWELRFTIITLASGTIPLVSFWAERRATARVRAEYADELDGAHHTIQTAGP